MIIERHEPGPFGYNFKHPKINDMYIAAHSNPKCKHCKGKGKFEFDSPTTGIKWVEACKCIFRK